LIDQALALPGSDGKPATVHFLSLQLVPGFPVRSPCFFSSQSTTLPSLTSFGFGSRFGAGRAAAAGSSSTSAAAAAAAAAALVVVALAASRLLWREGMPVR